jgi:hypothetical protein
MKYSQKGQALLEYLIILIIISFIGIRLVRGVVKVINDSVGSFNHVVSRHLTTGVCKRDCFFSYYGNGYRE